jgi:multisubunit Na+/H+ antiporter MnhB subunit
MEPEHILYFIPIIAILGGFTIAITAILSGMRMRELKIRERIAMIEKGLVPPPEVDPAGFDRVMGRHSRSERRGRYAASRHRRAGIMLIGVGLGLMVMRGNLLNGPGGFLAILGLAFIVSSLFEPSYESSGTQPPPTPPTPPSAQ